VRAVAAMRSRSSATKKMTIEPIAVMGITTERRPPHPRWRGRDSSTPETAA
jgi:hypothetical protein